MDEEKVTHYKPAMWAITYCGKHNGLYLVTQNIKNVTCPECLAKFHPPKANGSELKERFEEARKANQALRALLYRIWHDDPDSYPDKVVKGAEQVWDDIDDISIWALQIFVISEEIDGKELLP